MTCPQEAVRIASLPDDYQSFVSAHASSDSFLFKCVNMGMPLRTGMCLDDAVHNLLMRAGVEFDVSEEDMPTQDSQFDVAHEASVDSSVESWAGLLKNVRSI